MTDPRPCDECGRTLDAARLVHEVLINPHAAAADYRRRLCPRCARRHRAARRSGPVAGWARDAARGLLERSWGEPLGIYWLRQGERRWGLLCRRKRRRHQPENRP